MLQIIVDSNIFIYRERTDIERVASLFKAASSLGYKICIHPTTKEEVSNKDGKLNAYAVLENPPDPNQDNTFLSIFPEYKSPNLRRNDRNDLKILYAIYRDRAHLLITNDQRLRKRARKIGKEEQILSIETATARFEAEWIKENPSISTPVLRLEPMGNLELSDSFFDSLKEDYEPKFTGWWQSKCKEDKKAWVCKQKDKIKALLFLQIQEEPVGLQNKQALPKKKRIKISTLKSELKGAKISQLFLSIIYKQALSENIEEILVTLFPGGEKEILRSQLLKFGFEEKGTQEDGQRVFLKSINKPRIKENSQRHHPQFIDNPKTINKFIIPIIPQYYDRLFILSNIPRQTSLLEHQGIPITEGTHIQKAYICHSRTIQMKKGDLIFFRRSKDLKAIGCMGVVESVEHLNNPDQVMQKVFKRTVYSYPEIREMCRKSVTVILFRWHANLDTPHKTPAYQRLSQMDEDTYKEILKRNPTIKKLATNQEA